jgi:V/A-type H+-transporting ATPase subunit C
MMMAMLGNTPYVAARAKSRRQKLADRARLRQLINQSPEQMTIAVGDMGYRAEMDLYAGKYSGGDLVEAALTHNLEHELKEIVGMCNGVIRAMVEIYTLRFEYQNAKVVLRAVINDVDQDKVSNNILPALNDINTPWLKMIENADLMSLQEDAKLADYENALDRHYFKKSLASLSLNGKGVRLLKDLLKSEIDHRNIINIIEAEAVGIDSDDIVAMLIPGGRLIPERAFSSIAAGGKDAALDILRGANRFEGVLAESKSVNSLDPVITWFNAREHALLQRMSYLYPVSALPVVNYVAMKVQEVADLRLIVRGRLAGLPAEVLEAHIL